MPKITNIKARQVFDSRGNPTIESEIHLDDGCKASAIVPSGASTGSHEAFELRDVENKKYLGKSVLKAIEKVNGEISKALTGFSAEDQKKIDKTLIELDGTKQKKRLGANAILSVSLASNKAAAVSKNIPLYKNIGNEKISSKGVVDVPRFRLSVVLESSTEAVLIQLDNTATRQNLRVKASFTLTDLSSRATVFKGNSVSVGSYNVVDTEFATISAEDNAAERAVREIGEEIFDLLVVHFNRNDS